MEEKKYFKYIICSFSGVFCKTVPVEDRESPDIALIQNAFKNLKCPIPEEEAIKQEMGMGSSPKAICESLGSENAQELHAEYMRLLDEEYIGTMQLVKGASELLERLKSAGVEIIMVDFRTPETVREALINLKISNYVSTVIDTEENGSLRKGQPGVFKLIQEKYPDLTRENTIVVGHQNADIIFAHHKDVNLPIYWAKYGGGDYKMCMNLNPDKTFYNVQHLLRLISLTPPSPSNRATP
jgi:phosphoglycolate phosphatase-like HAD superfamily hydrolase